MVKFSVLVLSVMCGALLSDAALLPSVTCPNLLQVALKDCTLNLNLNLDDLLDICNSSALKCIANSVLGTLKLDTNTTQYNDQSLIDAYVNAGVSLANVQSCLVKVDAVIGTQALDVTNCQNGLVGAVGLCLLENSLGCTIKL